MKRLWLIIPFLVSCLPQAPKDAVQKGAAGTTVVSPFDPLAVHAWHLENTGQKSFAKDPGIAGEDHKIAAAHALGFTGKNIRIAVSDDGAEIDHADLKNNALSGEHRNYYTGSHLDDYLADPAPINPVKDFHGTAVTGIINAEKGNTVGSYGVAPDARFAAFNFIKMSYDSYVILHQTFGDFHIFNNSWGTDEDLMWPMASYQEDLEDFMAQGVDEGSVYVKAAGNGYFTPLEIWSNSNFDPMNTIPYYIIAGAVNARGVKSSYSSPGSNLWISGAGGEDGNQLPAIITTDLSGCLFGRAHQYYGSSFFDLGLHELNPYCDFTNSMKGTSSATPVISGIIALMLEANPSLTWRDIKHILAETADVIDYHAGNNILLHPDSTKRLTGHTYDVKWTQNKAGYFFSNWYGFGRANALKAVQMAVNYTWPLGTYIEGAFQDSVTNTQVIPDHTSAGLTRSISVTTSVTKIESVQVHVTVNHPDISELGFELTSPQGTVSRLLLINSDGLDVATPRTDRVIALLSNAFYGENPKQPNSTWTLKVVDGKESVEQGNLLKWSIKINGR